MGNIIHFGKKPLPPCYKGWRRVLLDGYSVADIRGAILIDGELYSDPELIGWVDESVWVQREDGWRISVWVDDCKDDPVYVCLAVADSAPFFIKRRFGEANQPDYHGLRGEIQDYICLDEDGADQIRYEVDHYSARAGNLAGIDVDQWEAEKEIGEIYEGTAKTRFKAAYRAARTALRRPNVVLLELDPGFVARRKK
jgi:hypothetical protein